MSLKDKLFSIFKGKARPASSNPYFAARRTWNDHLGSLVTKAQGWQVIGILSLLVALTAVKGNVEIGKQSKFLPYIVEVNALGEQQSYAQAKPLNGSEERVRRVIRSRVAQFVADIRMVTPDVVLQRNAIFQTYAVLSSNDPATKKANQFLNPDNGRTPWVRAKKETVSVEIRSVMPQSPETWQVDWIETTRDREGSVLSTVQMRAMVTVYLADPTDDKDQEQDTNDQEDMWRNPIRLFVRDFDWAKQV